jgi:hypothetical protein
MGARYWNTRTYRTMPGRMAASGDASPDAFPLFATLYSQTLYSQLDIAQVLGVASHSRNVELTPVN